MEDDCVSAGSSGKQEAELASHGFMDALLDVVYSELGYGLSCRHYYLSFDGWRGFVEDSFHPLFRVFCNNLEGGFCSCLYLLKVARMFGFGRILSMVDKRGQIVLPVLRFLLVLVVFATFVSVVIVIAVGVIVSAGVVYAVSGGQKV